MKLYFSFFLWFDTNGSDCTQSPYDIVLYWYPASLNRLQIVSWQTLWYWRISNRHQVKWCNVILWWNLWCTPLFFCLQPLDGGCILTKSQHVGLRTLKTSWSVQTADSILVSDCVHVVTWLKGSSKYHGDLDFSASP